MNKTKIDWADSTWNYVTGCTPISEACDKCYAKRVSETRLRGRHGYDQNDPFRNVGWHEKIQELPGEGVQGCT